MLARAHRRESHLTKAFSQRWAFARLLHAKNPTAMLRPTTAPEKMQRPTLKCVVRSELLARPDPAKRDIAKA